uniref:C2 domain-containing protein n=1 Tax=Ananas comosus var. bracteatus TaxID=296719 RepID=A0A6V7PZA1_ANACO|nr:unnamed protein product [Ananas comosus var. bracteatus]
MSAKISIRSDDELIPAVSSPISHSSSLLPPLPKNPRDRLLLPQKPLLLLFFFLLFIPTTLSPTPNLTLTLTQTLTLDVSGGARGGRRGRGGGEGGEYYPSPPPFPYSFHLVEVTVISAQELFPASRAMQTYAVAWVDAAQKVRTRLDRAGHTDPAWNDKFVFRVGTRRSAPPPRRSPSRSTRAPASAARSCSHRARPPLHPPPFPSPRFAAVQVRRPLTLRPQGILNLSVSLLDAYARSLPLFADLAPNPNPNPNPNPKEPSPAAAAMVVVDKEREEMEAKLEKWRAELPPMKKGEGAREEKGLGGRARRRNSFGKFSCFSPVTESGEVAKVRFAREREISR